MTTKRAPAKPHAFAGFDDFIEVFRSGEHTSSSGEKRTWTDAELDQMVANHNAEHPAPAVVGHPKDDAPAYGWIDQLKRVGSTLLAKFKDVEPAFAEAVKANRYRNRSIQVLATDAGFTVGHVGWLGAAPPAVKGLKPLSFATDFPSDVFEFALDVASTTEPPQMFTQADLDKAAADAAKKATDDAKAAAKTELDTANGKLKTLEHSQRVAECKAVIQGLAVRGQDVHLTPAQTEGLAEFRAQLLGAEAKEFTFTAEDKTEKKVTLVAAFDGLLKALPSQMKLGQEQAKTDPASDQKDPIAIAAKASEFQAEQLKAGNSISIAAAVAHVTAQKK